MKEALNCCEVDPLADLITQRTSFVEHLWPPEKCMVVKFNLDIVYVS